MKHRLPAIGAALALSACATTGDADRSYFDAEARRSAAQPVAIVVDACIGRDEVGEDFLLRKPSQDVAEALAKAATARLTAAGYRVSRTLIPALCNTARDPEFAGLTAVESVGGARLSLRPPFPGRDATDPRTAAAYRQLFQLSVHPDTGPSYNDEDPLGRGPLKLDPGYTEVLTKALGSSKVWVVRATGAEVSMGKRLSTGLLTAVASGAVSGGSVVYSTALYPGMNYSLALVDLAAGNSVWRKFVPTQPVEPTDLEKYDGEWVTAFFEPFLEDGVRIEGVPAVAAASAPAVVPVAAPAASTPSAVQTPHARVAAPLRPRPMEVAGTAMLVAGEPLTVQGSIVNPSGDWRYVRARNGQGWIKASEME